MTRAQCFAIILVAISLFAAGFWFDRMSRSMTIQLTLPEKIQCGAHLGETI